VRSVAVRSSQNLQNKPSVMQPKQNKELALGRLLQNKANTRGRDTYQTNPIPTGAGRRQRTFTRWIRDCGSFAKKMQNKPNVATGQTKQRCCSF
jgi:hypothetical protein